MLMYGRLPKPKGEMPDTSHKSKQCGITLLLPRGFSRIQYSSFNRAHFVNVKFIVTK